MTVKLWQVLKTAIHIPPPYSLALIFLLYFFFLMFLELWQRANIDLGHLCTLDLLNYQKEDIQLEGIHAERGYRRRQGGKWTVGVITFH
jgi:hypothetical protein